ncbi:MAG: M56 family metallopeptidase [Gemmatimonadota bacterium]|jgi:beta-lactamase regulating signal transducer with metallopeptidase domain
MAMTSLAQSTPWVATELVKATVWLLAVFAAAVSLRRASAGARHLVWSLGIVGALALPIVSLALPWHAQVLPVHSLGSAAVGERTTPNIRGDEAWASSTLPSTQAEQASAEAATTGNRSPGGLDGAVLEGARSAIEGTSSSRAITGRAFVWSWPSMLLALWLAGVLLVLSRLGLGWWLVRRVASTSEKPDDSWLDVLRLEARRIGLSRPPCLALSRAASMPFACGVLRPTIVLPEDALQWGEERVRAVLLHELAHLRRRDIPLNFLARMACGIYWFHPLVWAAARRLRSESERACDDLVLGAGTRASDYAGHLLEIMRRVRRAHTPAIAVPMARRGEIEGRMLAILEPVSRRGQPSRRQAALALLGVAALVFPLAALAPAPPDETPAEHATAAGTHDRRALPESLQPAAIGVPETLVNRDRDATPRQRPAPPPTGGAPAVTVLPAPKIHPAPGHADPQQARQQPGPDVVGALIKLLSDSVAEVRLEAVYALARQDDPRIAGPIAQRLANDQDAEVREMAAWALSEVGAKDHADVLANAVLHDDDGEVRATAAWALGHLRDPATTTALVGALSDANAEVRQAAAWGLGQIRPAHAPDALRKALKDADADVREAAAWAIGQGGDASAAADLGNALGDPDPDVRKAAIWALGRVDGPGTQAVLVKALDSSDPDVRAAAARALSGHSIDPWPWPWPRPRIR